MSWLPGIARLFFPTAASDATVTIVAAACVSDEATRRTTRNAGPVSWKNRLTPRRMFTPFDRRSSWTRLRRSVQQTPSGGQVQHRGTRQAHPAREVAVVTIAESRLTGSGGARA